MYTLGIILTVVGVVGLIVTLIWILVDNIQKKKQRENIINNIRNQQNQQSIRNNRVQEYDTPNLTPREYSKQDINKIQFNNQNLDKNINSNLNSESLADDSENYTDDIPIDELSHKINLQKDELTYICPNCKAQLKKDSKFCSNCGQRLV